MIADVIDADQEEGMLIAAGVSEKLDGLKHTYHGLPDFLTHVVEAEMARIPRHLSDAFKQQLWSIIYMPQVPPHAATCMQTCFYVPSLYAMPGETNKSFCQVQR